MPKQTATAPRRPYHHGDLAGALKSAVLELVEVGGIASVTMAEAARRAGVSSGAPYHHFGNIDALLSATAIDAYQRFRHRQDRIIAEHPDPLERLTARIDDFFAFATEEPAAFTLIFDTYTRRSAELEPFARHDWEMTLEEVAAIVGAPVSDCRELALGVSAVVFGHAQMTLSHYSPVSTVAEAPTLTHHAIALLLDGFRSRITR